MKIKIESCKDLKKKIKACNELGIKYKLDGTAKEFNCDIIDDLYYGTLYEYPIDLYDLYTYRGFDDKKIKYKNIVANEDLKDEETLQLECFVIKNDITGCYDFYVLNNVYMCIGYEW